MARLNRYLIKSTIIGALGGLLFGFDSAVIAGSLHSLRQLYALSPVQIGITVSSALLGTIFGAMLSGVIGERLGGRETLRICAVCYFVSAIGCAIAPNWTFLLALRFIGGLGIGGSSVLGPVYIAELAPAEWRGRMVGTFQFNIVVGVLVAYLSNYLIGFANLGGAEWRVQLGVAAFPAALFFLLLFGTPQSPRWLVTRGKIEEAGRVLNLTGSSEPSGELADIMHSLDFSRAEHVEAIFQWKYRLPLLLAITLAFFNQMVGINAIAYYVNDIFSIAGSSKASSELQAVAIGATNLVATVLAMLVIDYIGRKMLLLIGSVGMAILLAGVSEIFAKHQHQQLLLPLLVGYIFFFAISQGAVIWVYISEIFPNSVRAKGQSVGSSTMWVANAVIAAVFPLWVAGSPAYPFMFFAVMAATQFFVVLFLFPETKGISLEAMQQKFHIMPAEQHVGK